MTTPNDGGPAFPRNIHWVTDESDGNQPNPGRSYSGVTDAYNGMTLRDWFAGMALQGMMSYNGEAGKDREDYYAEISYRHADAMLAERSKK